LGSPTKTSLEAAFESGVFSMYLRYSLRVVAADGTKFSAGQGGLEHVGGVDGAFCRSGSDQGVEFRR